MGQFIAEAGTLTFVGSTLLDGDADPLVIENVTVNVTVDTVEVYGMGASGRWVTSLASTRGWEVSFDIYLDSALGTELGAGPDTSTLLGSQALLTFDSVAGPQYQGTATITSTSITVPTGDAPKVSMTAIGTGALTESFPA